MSGKKPPMRCISFDVGGTSLRAAAYDPRQQTISQIICRSTPNHLSLPDCTLEELRHQLFSVMEEMARSLLDGELPDLVGLAFPGPLDSQGCVYRVPTVFGSRGGPRPIGRELANFWPGAHIVLMNDVTAAGYYYRRSPHDSFCITTVSSGVGNKVFVDGRVVVGPAGRGGEIGHIVVDPSPAAPLCDCGGRGHLGGIASGRGTLEAVITAVSTDSPGFRSSQLHAAVDGQVGRITNEAIVAAFHENDPWVRSQIARTAAHLARVLAGIHCAVGTERFVLIGGFALALGENYRRLLAQLAAASCWNLGQDWPSMFELGTAAESAALIGAGRAAVQDWESSP
jgi:C7-cyclitol 7-kinase